MGVCNLYSKATTQMQKEICGKTLSIVCKQVTPDQAIQDALSNSL